MVAIWERQRSQAHSKLHLNSSTMGQTAGNFYTHTGARISKNRLVTELLRLSKFQSECLRPFISIFGVETQLFCTAIVVVTVAQKNICAIVHCNADISVLILDTAAAVNLYV